MSKIDIGLKEKDREAVANGLSALLADSYTEQVVKTCRKVL